MAKQDARKQFVQSRLKAIGGDATPEQKAKLRQRFNKLSETKEGRTRIAQVVLPSATAEQRKALKQSLRPTKTSTTSTVTSPTVTSPTVTSPTVTGSKVDLTGVRDARPYRPINPTIISNSNIPKNNSQSSAVIPSSKITLDTPVTKFKFPKINIGPATELPLGVGGVVKGVKEVQKGNYFGGVGRTLLGVAEVGVSVLSMVKGGRGKPLQIGPGPKPGPTYYGTQFTPKGLIGPAPKPATVTVVTPKPVTPKPSKTTPEFVTGGVDKLPEFKNPSGTKTPPKSKPSKETPGGKPPTTTVPKTTATTVPKAPTTTVPKKTTVTTVSTSVSPPTTAPRQYDPQGKGIGEPLDIRVGDPMPVKPAKPAGVSKVKFEMSDQMIDYEVRLANYYRYNKITPPKKK